MDSLLPLKFGLEQLLESLNYLALIELEKPCVVGVILNPFSLNQLMIAEECIKCMAQNESYKKYYFLDTKTLSDIVVVFSFKDTGIKIDSPVDLSLLSPQINILRDGDDIIIVMVMDHALFQIYANLDTDEDFKETF